MSKKIAALYLRLSDEDDNEEKDELLDESNSISSQRELLSEYVRDHNELAEYQLIEFCDDGYSGTNFSRPGVQNMLEQIRNGVISCVLVKDFSRFGRNYIEVGNYLEQVFPFLGIRFISINDCFDSNITACSGEFIDVAFKNLIYDLYSKDLSVKITSVRRSKAEQGKFITAYAPYGFQKTPEQKLIADPETAPIVQRIFRMAEDGIPKAQIAKTLNAESVLTPIMIRKQRGQHFPCKRVNEKSVWRISVISSILKDQRYTGDAVYGKVVPTAVGSGKDKMVPSDQWIIVPNAHETIISREQFEMVNALFRRKVVHSKQEPAALAGKVRCGACNHLISRKRRNSKRHGELAEYRCPTLTVTNEFGCYESTIDEKQIEQSVLTLLQKASEVLMDMELTDRVEQNRTDKIQAIENLLIKNASDIQKAGAMRLNRYEAYKSGSITKAEFICFKEKSDFQVEQLSVESERKRQELYALRCVGADKPDSVSMIKKMAPFETLTREAVETFVRQIYVLKDGTLKIEWKFDDFFRLIK